MSVDTSTTRAVRHSDHPSHALLVPLPPGRGAHDLTERLRVATADLAPARLWCERLSVVRDDPRAESLRERELRRAVADDVAVRVVVLDYADGLADLVVSARRDLFGQTALARLAAALAGPGEPSACGPVALAPTVAETVASPEVPAWGLGGRRHRGSDGTVTIEWSADHDLVAALAVVLRRYDPDPVRFAVVTAAAGAGPDEQRRYGGEVTDETPLRDLPTLNALLAEPVSDGPADRAAIGVLVVEGAGGYGFGATAPFPITLVWRRGPGGSVTCSYDGEYLSPTIAAQFASHLGRAAHAIAQDRAARTDLRVGDVPLLTPAETAAVLAAGRTPAPVVASSGWAPAQTIHAAVEAAALATPDAIAYTDANGSLTYRELFETAGTVAGALREAGVAPGDRVGVCLTRGAELIVVLLAVLRAGATYVPMDTRHPVQRLQFTAQDAGIGLVVTDQDSFPPLPGLAAVHPSRLRDSGAKPPVDEARADDPAYVIYTSGSTGRPKGVQVPHRNVLALLAATASDMKLTSADVWTWFHSAAFDFAVWEIWGALTTGARLVGVSYETSRSPEEFYELLRERGVTVLNQTPSAFGALQRVDRARREDLALRLVIFGGETLDAATLRDWFETHPHTRCRLVNMYGITETTVHVTTKTLAPIDVADRTRSVGRALPGWSVSVRDPRGRPVPFGVAGEIYVGGAGVADGYLHRPELTAERFLDDPHGGGRVYRSGDYGRLHPDGSLDHLGRIDSQVQLRGHRVELEEIRSVLLEVAGVQAAAVVLGYAIPDDPESARLDAYIVTDASGGPTPAEVRRRVGDFLPEYMVPSTVTVLDALPLTVNGKVDVARLPRPGTVSALPVPDEPAPQGDGGTGVRAALRRVWAEVFQRPVGDEDDFFELGGNSLLALRLSAGLREAGLPPIAMRELYLHPCIDDQARVLESRIGEAKIGVTQ